MSERIQKTDIFPIGNHAATLAFREFFPRNPTEAGHTGLKKELDILNKHYPATMQYVGLVKYAYESLASMRTANLVIVGMNYFHSAARIEAQTKRQYLPAISDDQMMKYVIDSKIINLDENSSPTSVNTDAVESDFRAKELNITRNLEKFNSMGYGYLLRTGSALMKDFLINAPLIDVNSQKTT